MDVRFCRLIPGKGRVFTTAAAICFLLLFSSSAFAAGPSYVTIWMDPVAANPSGQVLLRTFYRSNQSGGQPLPGSEIRFGWLIVSAQGLWKEYGHVSMKETEGDSAEDKRQGEMFNRTMNEFESPFDWANPPASVQPILKTYKFSKAHAVDPRLGRGSGQVDAQGRYLEGQDAGARRRSADPRKDPVPEKRRSGDRCRVLHQGGGTLSQREQTGDGEKRRSQRGEGGRIQTGERCARGQGSRDARKQGSTSGRWTGSAC